MQTRYLGQIAFADALALQDVLSHTPGTVLGFEPTKSVVTLGRRANPDLDVLHIPEGDAEILHVERGGQATLHQPGQLVIFPVLDVRRFGARRWIAMLSRACQTLAVAVGDKLTWDESAPGLYRGTEKIVSLGVRLQRGVSTHGVAINVHNDLTQFSWIRPCGRADQRMGRLRTDQDLSALFQIWVRALKAEVDNSANLAEFGVGFNTDGSVGAVGSAFP